MIDKESLTPEDENQSIEDGLPEDESELDEEDEADQEDDEDDEDDEDQEDYEDGYGCVCPVCGPGVTQTHPCPHFVSTWEFSEGGHWAGDFEKLHDFHKEVYEFTEVVNSFDDPPNDLIKKFLPRKLKRVVDEAVSDGTATCACNHYLASLITRSPTYIGCSDDESCSLGMSSSWKNYWAEDAAACAKAIEEQLAKDGDALRKAAEKLQAYWDETEGKGS